MGKQSNSKTNGKAYEIAVIGARGSGKTTLAAGLYASSTDDFTVGTDDKTSEDYLKKLKSKLQDGYWPESTLIHECPDIKLRINEGPDRVTAISFEDYMGERLSTDANFIEDHVKTPDGAILLFNPGMDILSDTQERNNIFSLYRKIIDHLHKCGCRHVAFVVTAADRLEGDLKDRRDILVGYEKEITNYLETVGGSKWWSRILVTVTGKLESQTTPALASGDANTARLPFVYLLAQLKKDEKRRRFWKILMRVCLAAFLSVLAIAGVTIYKYFCEKNEIHELKQAVKEFEPKSSSELGKAKDLKDDLENKYDKLNELTPWFNANRRIWAATTNEWTSLKEVRTYTYLCCAIDDLLCNAATNGTDANISLMEDSVNGYHPVNNQKLSKDLNEKWAGSKPNIQRIYDGENHKRLKEAIARVKDLAACIVVQNRAKEWKPVSDNERKKNILLTEIDKCCRKCAEAEWTAFETGWFTNATVAAVGGFGENLKEWAPVSSDTKAVQSNLLARLPDMAVKWCTEYKIVKISELCKKNGVTVNDGLGPLRDSLFVPMTNGCSEAAYIANAKKLSDTRKRLLDTIVESYANRVWDSKSDDSSPDKWCPAIWTGFDESAQLESCITKDEKRDAESKLKSTRVSHNDLWYTNQKEIANKFLCKLAQLSSVDACTEYGDFCSEHPKNPELNSTNGKVRAAFLEKLKKEFRDYKEHYRDEFLGEHRIYVAAGEINERIKNAEEKFADFTKLCIVLSSDSSGTLTDSPYYIFACKAKPELQKGMFGAFQKKLKIICVKPVTDNIRFHGGGGDKLDKCYATLLYSRLSGASKSDKKIISDNYDVITYNPWQKLEFYYSAKMVVVSRLNNHGTSNTVGGFVSTEKPFEQGLKNGSPDKTTMPAGKITLMEGNTFADNNTYSADLSFEVEYSISESGGGFLGLWKKCIGE